MDLKVLCIIIVIIAAIIIEEFHKREKNRIRTNLHADNFKTMLTISALEYQHSHFDIVNHEHKLTEEKIALLVKSYEKGEIENSVFQERMRVLLRS